MCNSVPGMRIQNIRDTLAEGRPTLSNRNGSYVEDDKRCYRFPLLLTHSHICGSTGQIYERETSTSYLKEKIQDHFTVKALHSSVHILPCDLLFSCCPALHNKLLEVRDVFST